MSPIRLPRHLGSVAIAILILLAGGCAPSATPTAPAAKPATPASSSPAAPATAPTTVPTAAPATAAKPKETTVVNLGVTRLIADAPLQIAIRRGYFKEQGIEVKIGFEGNVGDAMAPLSTGQLSVVGGGVSIATFNAITRGMPVKMVADRSYLTPGFDGNFWMVRQDLKDKITKITDLKGRKLAINGPTSVLVYVLGKTFAKAGMSTDDVDLKMIGFPEMGAAFANGAIDAAIVVEPNATVYESQGLAVKWKEVSEYINDPYMEAGVLLYNKDWATQNDALAKGFMVALLKGARDYNRAMKGGPNRPEVIKILTETTAVKDAGQWEQIQWSGVNPDLYVDKKSLADQVDWYFDHKLLTTKPALDQVIDNSYVDYAVQQLGRFSP